MKPVWLIPLLAVLAAGCAGIDNREPAAELESFTASLRIDRAWRVNLDGIVGEQIFALKPAVDSGRVYVAGRRGRVYAFAMEDGDPIWSTGLDTELAAGPGVGEGLAVVATSEGVLVALDVDDGTERWRVPLDGEILSTPAVDNDVVAVRTSDGRLVVMDAADGHVMWSHEQQTPALTLRGSAAPVIAGDLVIAGYENGRLVANHVRDGQSVWETPLSTPRGRTEVERMVDVNATPRVVGRDLYAVNFHGRMAAMSVESGRILWSHPLSSTSGLGTDPRMVFVTDEASEIHAYDRLTGTRSWSQAGLRARSVTAPVSHRDTVVVGDFKGYLHWLSKETGEFVARERVDRFALKNTPVVFGDMLFVQGDGGTLTAFRIAD